jgi:hypothetical protein
MPTFHELEGLMLQEELGRNIEKSHDEVEEVLATHTSNFKGSYNNNFRGSQSGKSCSRNYQ